jgi:hypothetical protein
MKISFICDMGAVTREIYRSASGISENKLLERSIFPEITDVAEWDGITFPDMIGVGKSGFWYYELDASDVYDVFIDCEKINSIVLTPMWKKAIDTAIEIAVQFERDKKIKRILE